MLWPEIKHEKWVLSAIVVIYRLLKIRFLDIRIFAAARLRIPSRQWEKFGWACEIRGSGRFWDRLSACVRYIHFPLPLDPVFFFLFLSLFRHSGKYIPLVGA